MKLRKIAPPLITCFIGIAIGFVVSNSLINKERKSTFIERREGGYSYINPLLDCDVAEKFLRNQKVVPFKNKIETYLNTRLHKQSSSSVSVYFRELNDGLWFSIGDTEKFVPASLRKLPLMIALLKQAEKTPKDNLLDRKVQVELSQDYNANQNIRPSQPLVLGQKYTIRELIFRMVVYSDNNAFTFLTRVVDATGLDEVYAKLRMQNPQTTQDDEFLSVQTYASFFRILYNATYLNKEHSEWALDVLSKSEFRAGLVSGVPSGINVAHKFGEKSDSNSGTVQLHDCGIVYYPQHPYLLCVMSKGPDFDFLDDVIREISDITFREVDFQHRNQ